MALTAGTRLGPYEILSPLGAGGMGEVYRARDTRLDRIVAVKVLPEQFAADPQFRERFEREARLVASLNHAHICTIHDVGRHGEVDFLVMEHLEGMTLQERLQGGAVPVPEALRLGIQMADALTAAHRAGVVHRDLKPGNIMLTKAGAKLLDFGLAKVDAPAVGGTLSMLPTTPPGLTVQGTILGTFQYMAPEQLEGKDTDARTDIFAFGSVLYEMLTGRKAFEGQSQASLIGAILKDAPPPVSSIQRVAPPSLDRLVADCLAKNPDDRWHAARDVMLQLRAIADGQADTAARRAPAVRARIGERVLWAITLALIVGSALYFRPATPVPAVYRSSINMPPGTALGYSTRRPSDAEVLSLSPDGRSLVIVATADDGTQQLWLQRLDAPAAQPLAGTEGGSSPFWSPDGRSVGFFADGRLKRLEIGGGTPITVCDAVDAVGGTWSQDGVILFGAAAGAIQRVPAAGGAPTPATQLGNDEIAHWAPFFLPDGRHFIYTAAIVPTPSAYVRGVIAAALDSPDTRLLVPEQTNAQYANGHLLYVRSIAARGGPGAALIAQPFDATSLQLDGAPVTLAENVQTRGIPGVRGVFSTSATGVLVAQLTSGPGSSRLHWYDRAGRDVGQLGDVAAAYVDVALSRDGSQAAVSVVDSSTRTSDIWLYDTERGVRTRFTSDAADDMGPIWSPDGRRIAFMSNRKGVIDVFLKNVAGTSSERALIEDVSDKYPESWSSDGKAILFTRNTTGVGIAGDLYWLPLTDERKGLVPLLVTAFNESASSISPDGRWVAFESNESGRDEIYVAPFPQGEPKSLVSTNGGRSARWRRDGRELFYVDASGMLAAVPADASGAGVKVGTTQRLFRIPPRPGRIPRYGGRRYDVTSDGNRFLVEIPVTEATPPSTALVVNWPALLRK